MQSQYTGDFPISNRYHDTKRNYFVILASPGHYRDSLVGLLRNLSDTEIVFYDYDHKGLFSSSKAYPSIVLVDLASLSAIPNHGRNNAEGISAIRDELHGARIVLLVDNIQQSREAQKLGADFVLPRSISAGQFLKAIRNLEGLSPRIPKYNQDFSLSSRKNQLLSPVTNR